MPGMAPFLINSAHHTPRLHSKRQTLHALDTATQSESSRRFSVTLMMDWTYLSPHTIDTVKNHTVVTMMDWA